MSNSSVPVVFLGSLGATAQMWQPQLDSLGAEFQCIALDLLGHGSQPAPEGDYSIEQLANDVLARLDDQGVSAFHLVGLSLGGAVAQMIALEHPERLVSLTLAATAPKFGEAQAWLDKAELVRNEGTGALAETVVGNWFTDACFEKQPELPESYAEAVRATNDTGYAGCCMALAGFDSRERLGEIRVPTLVIAGEQDTSTALDVVQQLHTGISGSTMVTISEAKHLVNVEKAGYFNAALREHLQRS